MTKWSENIKEFRKIKDGWFDGNCKAPSKKSIDNADKYMCMISGFNFSIPLLRPYSEGGIIGEWTDLGHDIIFHNNGQVEYANYNDESFETVIKRFELK